MHFETKQQNKTYINRNTGTDKETSLFGSEKRYESFKTDKKDMYLPRKSHPLVWRALQSPPYFARKNGAIGTASDSLISNRTRDKSY